MMSVEKEKSNINNNMGLQNLLNEPERLASESERLNLELENLVLDNYRIFVENLTCSVHLRAEDKTLGDISADLQFNLNDLSKQCFAFKDRVSVFVSSHKRNRKTLQHHMQLVELLEVPQLVDACARNGFHDEALELANFVNGLERRHLLATEVKSINGKIRGGSGVVQTIVDDVHETLGGLRSQLLQQLTNCSSLPKEIHILSILRKLDRMLIDRHLSLERHSFERDDSSSHTNDERLLISDLQRDDLRQQFINRSEVRLQMDFLESRSIWLDQSAVSDAVKTSDHSSSGKTVSPNTLGPYGRIIEMLEARRTSWFSVIAQFTALFQPLGDDGDDGSNTQLQSQEYSGKIILNSWVTGQIQVLLTELKDLLPQIDEGGSLRSVLEQTLFFAHRMGQVGCDFTELVLPLFKSVIEDRVRLEMQVVREHFKTIMLCERIVFRDDGSRPDANDVDFSSADQYQLIPLYSDQAATHSRNTGLSGVVPSTPADNELSTPDSLMRFPPLAYLANCVVTTLNFLRECPLVTVKNCVLEEVLNLSKELSVFIASKSAEICRTGAKYLNEDQSKGAGNKPKTSSTVTSIPPLSMSVLYGQAIAFDLFPHLLLCLEAIYSPNAHKIVERVRNFKLKHAINSASKASLHSNYLVFSATQGAEVLGKILFAKLNESCWRSLQSAELLPILPDINSSKVVPQSTISARPLATSRPPVDAASEGIKTEAVTTESLAKISPTLVVDTSLQEHEEHNE